MGRRGGVLAKNTDKTMKKIFGLGLAALMLALPGCVQDPTNDEGIAGGGTETVTVNVSVESLVNEDGTRITLGGESGNAFVWEAGDIIQFFYKASGNVTYTLTEGVDDAIIGQRLDAGAQFTLDIPAGETVKWAIKYTIVDDDVKKAGTSNIKSGKDGSVNPSATKVSYWSSDTIEGLVDRLIFVGKVNADGTCILRNTMGIAEVKFTGNGEKVWGVTLANRDYSLRTNWGYLQTTVDEPMFSSYYRYWNKGYDSQLGFAMYLTSNGPFKICGSFILGNLYGIILVVNELAATLNKQRHIIGNLFPLIALIFCVLDLIGLSHKIFKSLSCNIDLGRRCKRKIGNIKYDMPFLHLLNQIVKQSFRYIHTVGR